jgi:hypothetical protein
MKHLIKLSGLFVSLAFLFGCAGLSPKDQVVADAVFVEALGAALDNNPAYKPIVLKIAQDAQTALESNAVITHDAAAQWVLNQIVTKLGDNPRVKRLSFVLLSAYMPDWSGSTMQFVTIDQKKILEHVIYLTANAATP